MYSSEPLLELKNVNIVFQLDVHRPWTLKEAFVGICNDPLNALFRENDKLHVIKNVSLKAYKGERIGLLGVNGAGKTSLCRCIAGIYRPLSGTIAVNGKIRSVFNTGVGIHPELTGRENARLLMDFMYPTDPDKEELLQSALSFTELGAFLDTPFKLYSNGMQVRLYLSLVSVKPSDVIILDEVFEGADALFTEKISKRMTELMERSGVVCFVSHSLGQVKRVCTRVIVLNDGSIAYDGPTQEGVEFYCELTKRLQSHGAA